MYVFEVDDDWVVDYVFEDVDVEIFGYLVEKCECLFECGLVFVFGVFVVEVDDVGIVGVVGGECC